MNSRQPHPTAGADRSGLLLLRGGLSDVSAWVRRGIVPAAVVPMEGWTAVLPEERSFAEPPYTNGGLLLAGRHVPRKLGPGLGFWIVEGRAVITVQTRGRRGIRWVVWEPERGVVTPPDLPVAGPVTLQRVAGAGRRNELVEILHEVYVQPDRLLAAVVAVLELPGAKLLVDASGVADLPGATSVLPAPREVGYFNDAVRDAVTLRQELEA
ncbi:hypothetical protein [Ornithinimicrobium faecis]|uniref:Uncharacterized protein n=1 Tax=Ornithinimicrobium faecis TaxID=2934158 RepID=A0ABY4YNM8_9MICO|nr:MULTISPECIES: hypothetical protein [unclassified Ornithinimicrobium]USQ78401.1 hypothetical protein NF556_12175 [Ornithinimicrobium sp. HY1793]